MKPFAVISDLHFHAWDSFATTNDDGVNSRLLQLLDEVVRCAHELKDAGGDTIYCAGDVFHTRGQVSPLVLNPVIDRFKMLTDNGITINMISGNHDLQRRDSERLSSAITALEMPGVMVVNESTFFGDDNIRMIPWFESVNDLKEKISEASHLADSDTTLIIHAPVNGVLKGLPDTGLDPAWLASLGFKYVFAGHYHNHKEFPGGVYSVGALAHNTWSDVGSKAGFLIVDDAGVHWRKSHCPEFIDIDSLANAEYGPEDIKLMIDGNYVRVRTESSKTSDIEALRQDLTEAGAKGVLIRACPRAEVTRDGALTASIKSGASIGQSVYDYIKTKTFTKPEEVNNECQIILMETGIAGETV